MNQLQREAARSTGFFAAFERNANAGDMDAMAAHFAPMFLAGGPKGSQVVRREDFLAFLPKRYAMMRALGGGDSVLSALKEAEAGPGYLLAQTEWEVRATEVGAGALPVVVRSTFLLEKYGDGWQIIVYLAHDDLAALLNARQAGG